MTSIQDILQEQAAEYRQVRAHEGAILKFYASQMSSVAKAKPVSAELDKQEEIAVESRRVVRCI